MFHDVG